MTREEVINAILSDKLAPHMQDWELEYIIDFVIDNYKSQLPTDLDEAAEEYEENKVHSISALGTDKDGFAYYIRTGTSFNDAFKAGAEWMARQGVIIEGRIAEGHREGYPALCLPTNMDNRYSAFKPGDKVIVQIRKI